MGVQFRNHLSGTKGQQTWFEKTLGHCGEGGKLDGSRGLEDRGQIAPSERQSKTLGERHLAAAILKKKEKSPNEMKPT